jgi:hypothetical protein
VSDPASDVLAAQPARDLASDRPGRSLGTRVDALVATVKAQPLAAVGVGIVLGYVLARLLRSTTRV